MVGRALAFASFDQRFTALEQLVARAGGERSVRFARSCIDDGDQAPRALGFDIMGLLATGEPSLVTVLVRTLDEILEEGEPAPELAWSMAHSLSGLEEPAVIGPLVRLARCGDPDVRWQVAVGLGRARDRYDGRGVATLVELTADADAGVRDWATLELGSVVPFDTPEVREVLVARLDDPVPDVRGEALVGLARRRSEVLARVLPPLLTLDRAGTLEVRAAMESGDRSYLPLLERLAEEGWDEDPELLSSAVAALGGAEA